MRHQLISLIIWLDWYCKARLDSVNEQVLTASEYRANRRDLFAQVKAEQQKRRLSPAEFRELADRRLNPVEFRAMVESLGMTFEDIARIWNLNVRTPQQWATGKSVIPFRVPGELAAIKADTDAAIKVIAAGLPRRVALDVDYGERWRRVATVRAAESIGFTGDLTEALTPPK